MSNLNKTQIENIQSRLLNSFEKLRQAMTDSLVNSSQTCHTFNKTQLQQLSTDEILDLIVKADIVNFADKVSAMKSIDAALYNIQIEMYGLCADCEEMISLEQLDREPTTQRCLTCENKYRKQRYNSYKL